MAQRDVMRAGRRRTSARILTRVGVVLATLVVVLLVYGTAIEPRLILDERRYQAEIPGLPDAWDGAQVAVFSDLQVGMWLDNSAMVERVVNRVIEEQPAAVLLAGDFLYSTDPDPRVQIDTVLMLLAPLTASELPVFAVLGNHDYHVGAADALAQALQRAGIEVLRNEAAVVPAPDGDMGPALHIVGIGPAIPDRADPRRALAGLPADAPRVVLMHNPTTFPELPASSAPLAVAGHTHCGQVALPGAPEWSYIGLTREEAVVADGFAPEDFGAPGNRLFVTCGIGFSLAPIRINAPPQLVFFELAPPRGA